MKKINIQVAIFSFIALVCFGVINITNAAGASLYVSPAVKNVNVGDVISSSVGISAGGNMIYAIEGTLVFDKLSCQSISVASGLQVLASPTCNNPKFILGIPSGSSNDKTLLNISTKASLEGDAKVSISGVKIVGGDPIETISTSAGSGNYKVSSVVEVIEAIVEEPESVVTPIKPVEKNKFVTKTTDTIVPEEIPEISLANTTTPSVNTTTPSVKQGTVLAGFEEEIPNNNSYSTFFTSNISRIVIGSLIAIAVLLVGFVFFKKKKV